MQFLVLTQRLTDLYPPNAWTPELLAAESNRVRELYIAGSVRSIWRRKDQPGAAILMEAATEDEIRALIATLPLAELGMISFPIVTQLDPYPGFAPR